MTISHNIIAMDVSAAVKVSQYTHVHIKCNRKSEFEPLEADCGDGHQSIKAGSRSLTHKGETGHVVVTTDSPPVRVESVDGSGGGGDTAAAWWSFWEQDQLPALALTGFEVTSFVLLLVGLVLTALFLAVYLCCWCRSHAAKDDKRNCTNGNATETRGIAELIRATSHLGTRLIDAEGGSGSAAPMALREADEYSNSSRAHLAHGMDPPPGLLQYIRVEGVTAEEEEGGVVCGHLTLGPSFTVGDNNTSVRTASCNRLKQQTFSRV